MGVYIKGIEMPLPGTFNIIYIYSDGQVHMPSWGKGMTPANGVKAIPIPPHGRLIDADKLKETLDYYIREAGWSDEINKALSWVKDEFIDSEQAIIPASEEGET